MEVRLAVAIAAVVLLGTTACDRAASSAVGEANATASAAVSVRPIRATATLPNDPDDPAIWINPRDPSRSLIIGTIKVAAPNGGLAVFGLDGSIRQMVTGIDRPNNVDVEYGIDLDGTATDIAVATERLARKLRVFAIAPDGSGLRDISSRNVGILAGAPGEEGAPMGIALYKRPSDGAIFAIVAPKAGPRTGYLWQYRLRDDGTGRVEAVFVRRFGTFSGAGEIEAVVVDDELDAVYYADESTGIHKWRANPDAPDANRELALFATTGYAGDREGLAIYRKSGGTGFIVSADQVLGDSTIHFYLRQGEPGRPDDHTREVAAIRIGADATDGLDATSSPLGTEFPDGLIVAMNSSSRNFLIVRWSDVTAALKW